MMAARGYRVQAIVQALDAHLRGFLQQISHGHGDYQTYATREPSDRDPPPGRVSMVAHVEELVP